MPGVIIPRKTVTELRKLLEEVSGNVELGLSDTRVQFRVESVLLTSKLIDGTFPEHMSASSRAGTTRCCASAKRISPMRWGGSRPSPPTLPAGETVPAAGPPGTLSIEPRAGDSHRGTGLRPGEI